MRNLFVLGLTIFAVTSATAQAEVIIRRPGEKDQVIKLDSARARDAMAKARVELQQLQGTLERSLVQMRNAAPVRAGTIARVPEMNIEGFMREPSIRATSVARRQPYLGVVVATSPRESDRYGAYIDAVTPGSPADRAGLISGDIITKVAGKSLTEKDPKDDSGPGVRLISMIGTLTTGKSVDLDYRRGTQNKSTRIVPGETPAMARMSPEITELSRLSTDHIMADNIPLRLRELQATRPPSVSAQGFATLSGAPNNATFSYTLASNNIFASVELAPVNEKLGAYFGTSEGVLVVNTGVDRNMIFASGGSMFSKQGMGGDIVARKAQDSSARAGVLLRGGAMAGGVGRVTRDTATVYIDGVPAAGAVRKPFNLGLEPGDVIVSVDGRKVSSPSQLMRIVGTYEHNDEFKLQIMRQKRAETVTVKMP